MLLMGMAHIDAIGLATGYDIVPMPCPSRHIVIERSPEPSLTRWTGYLYRSLLCWMCAEIEP